MRATILEASAEADGPPSTASVPASGDQRIDGELVAVKWAGGALSYSFPDSIGDYDYTKPDFAPLTAAQMQVARDVLDADGPGQDPAHAGFSVEGFTNLSVSFAGQGSGAGTIRYARTTDTETAFGYYPSTSIYGGDTWYGQSGAFPEVGNYDYRVYIHETGHALGLKHGHDSSHYGALPYETDSMEYSVMTYWSYVGSDGDHYYNEWNGYAQTFMMCDIAALQYMYGADFETTAGNTTYAWDPLTGETRVDGAVALRPASNRIFLTIWDGGGTDTYDFSAYSTNLSVSLAPGGFSTLSSAQIAYLGHGHDARGNVFNALQYEGDPRSLIENALGGSGKDAIEGNAADNHLSGNTGGDTLGGLGGDDTLAGGGGPDVLAGGAGDDVLDGGDGTDRLDGGEGSDTVLYAANAGAVRVDLVEGRVSFPANGYAPETIVDIENAETGAGDDFFLGDGKANAFRGGAGDDSFDGGGGNDYFDGGAGTDTVLYTANASAVRVDLVAGTVEFPTDGWQPERFDGVENAATGAGADTLLGSDGTNELRGGAKGDRLSGGGGADVLTGGPGKDVFVFAAGDSVRDGRDTLEGGDGAMAFEKPGKILGDRLDLTAIDADATLADDQAFQWGGSGKGHIWATNAGDVTVLHGNVDNDATPEFELAILDGTVRAWAYTPADFVL